MIACVLVVDSLGPGPDAELRQASRRRPPLDGDRHRGGGRRRVDGVRARRRRAGARSHRQFDTAEEQSDEAGTKPSAAAVQRCDSVQISGWFIYINTGREGEVAS